MSNILTVSFNAPSYETAEQVSINRWMSFSEFCYAAKATGNRYEFPIKVITFYNITHIILLRLRV